jgi:hypothetical protein
MLLGKPYLLGSGMFTRFGVNYVQADFLTWDSNMKFDVIVGNPPYGRNTSLAIKFLNKSAELCENIHFVLPRSVRKPSVLKRINPHLHLVSDEDTSNDTFGGGIITCVQKWELRNELRVLEKMHTQHPDFQFVSKENANLFIGRCGAGPSGKVLTENFLHYADSHFFIKTKNCEVTKNLLSLAPDFYRVAREAVVSMPNLSKHEMITLYRNKFSGNEV